jgi:LysM repeat protein
MRKLFNLFLTSSFLLISLMSQPTRISAQAGDAMQLIGEVNDLRAAYGLPPYEVNNALMSAAQNHSDYQASIGTWTHSGSGGSRPYDRAVAAGYGGGDQVYVSENVAMGVNLSPTRTVNDLWQDAIHLDTMISPLYTHIGAGVGHDGDSVYYTILVAYVAGSSGSGGVADLQPPSNDNEINATQAPTVIPIEPIVIATAAADGSIQHVVQSGQFLENIANAYGVELSDLLALNGITEQAVIYPGDKLLIKTGVTAAPGALQLEAPTRELEETRIPSATATAKPKTETPTPMPVAMNDAPQPSLTIPATPETREIENQQAGNVDYLLYAVFGLAFTGIVMILFGSFLKKHA